MLSDILVKNILEDLKRTLLVQNPKQVEFLSIALGALKEFTTICQGLTSFQRNLEPAIRFANVSPTDLRPEDELQYALYIRRLFLDGACYGMVQEDPLNSLVLLGGAFQIVKNETLDDCTKYELVSSGLDLLFHQAVALCAMQEDDLAKHNLRTILEVASEIESLQQTYDVQDPHEILTDITARAAPSAWMMACILNSEKKSDQAKASLGLATDLYQQLLNKFAGERGREVAALLGFAEVLMIQDEYTSCEKVLDKAIRLAKKLLQKEVTAPHAFLAATACHKRGELYAMKKKWDKAFDHFHQAIKLVEMAVERTPNNTYYEERLSEYMNELGILYGVRGDLLGAQEIFLKTIQRQRVLAGQSEQYKTGLVATLNNMSILMNRYGNHQVAKRYLQESIEVVDAMEDHLQADNREKLRSSLNVSLEYLETVLKERKWSLWRPIWNPNASSSSLPN